jgi:hypothetical protein
MRRQDQNPPSYEFGLIQEGLQSLDVLRSKEKEEQSEVMVSCPQTSRSEPITRHAKRQQESTRENKTNKTQVKPSEKDWHQPVCWVLRHSLILKWKVCRMWMKRSQHRHWFGEQEARRFPKFRWLLLLALGNFAQ